MQISLFTAPRPETPHIYIFPNSYNFWGGATSHPA